MEELNGVCQKEQLRIILKLYYQVAVH